MGGRFRSEEIYIYLWLIHVDVWQKPTQYCKAIILQLNKFKKRISVNITWLQQVAKSLQKKEHSEKSWIWSGFSKVGLNLIREMDFINSRLIQNWICFSVSQENSFPGMLLLIKCVSFCAFKVKWKLLSRVRPFVTPWIESLEFSRPEYWSRRPFPSLGNLPNLGIESRSPALQADSLPAEAPGKPKNTGVGAFTWSLFTLEIFFSPYLIVSQRLWSYITKCFKTFWRKFLAVPWWGICACAAGDMGLIPDQRSKISQTARRGHKNFLKFLTDFPNVKF